MKFFLRFLLLFIFLNNLQNYVYAGFVFSSPNSTVRLKKDSKLNVTGSIVGWDGALIFETGASFVAPSVNFDGGRISDGSNQDSFISGKFEKKEDDLTYGNSIILRTNDQLEISGPVTQNVVITGTNVRIEGTPEFKSGIQMLPSTELTLGVRTVCNSNISTGTGTKITLEEDFSFDNTSKIIGGDTKFYCEGHALRLGGGTWKTDLEFKDSNPANVVNEIHIDGNTTWLFTGTNVINGHGSSIEIHQGSKLKIAADSTLAISSMILRGIENERLEFENENSILRLSAVDLDIRTDMNSTMGQLYIYGTSTILLKSFDWLFTGSSNLTVDSTTLWIDTMDRFEAPLFGKIAAAGSYLSYLNGATIKQMTDQAQVDSVAVRFLLSGSVSDTVFLDRSIFLHPKNIINFSGDSLVTASGSSMTFADVSEPQIVVNTGLNATFRDVSLLRINKNTFDIKENAILNLETDVTFELSENITFNNGLFKLTGDDNVCHFRGIGGQKKLIYLAASVANPPGFDLSANTLMLEDIDFSGLKYVTKSEKTVNNTVVVGSIGLLGGSIVNIENDTDMNFVIQGSGNELHLLKNDISLNGKIIFGDQTDNSLKIKFTLTEYADQYRVYLGDSALNLSSSSGRAGVTFDDADVTVVNKSANSIIGAANSYLGGNYINIESNPIRQTSSDFTLLSGLELASTLPNAIDTSQLKSPFEFVSPTSIVTTAFHRTRKLKDSDMQQLPSIEVDNYFPTAAARAIKIPKPNIRVKKRLQMGKAKGAVRIEKGGGLSSFAPDPDSTLALELSGGARINTKARRSRRASKPVRASESTTDDSLDTFKKGDQIFITGTDNKIVVTGNLDVKGELVFEEDSELIFEFDDSIDNEKKITFGDPDALESEATPIVELAKKSSLIFQGSGEVSFLSGTKIDCQGTPLDDVVVDEIDATYEDDRPNLIFKNYTQLVVDNSNLLELGGSGNLIFQDSAQAKILNGHLVIGLTEYDYFDLTVDRNSSIKLGNVLGQTSSEDEIDARLSLPSGHYNVKFSRDSKLLVRENGTFETSLLKGEYFGGVINFLTFSADAAIKLTDGGIFAVGQAKTDVSIHTELVPWDNIESIIDGNGYLALYSGESSAVDSVFPPIFKRVLQPRYFKSSELDIEQVAKKLTTKTAALTVAMDYVDENGDYKLYFFDAKTTVDLQSGDVVKFENASLKTVYLLDSKSRKTAVTSNGSRSTTSVAFP
jgi:hypothetical protein